MNTKRRGAEDVVVACFSVTLVFWLEESSTYRLVQWLDGGCVGKQE